MAKLYTRPTYPWPVLGLRGQMLGNIERCALDASTGELVSLELRTAWQKIDIEWPNIKYDEEKQSFKLNKSGSAVVSQVQLPVDVSGSDD